MFSPLSFLLIILLGIDETNAKGFHFALSFFVTVQSSGVNFLGQAEHSFLKATENIFA